VCGGGVGVFDLFFEDIESAVEERAETVGGVVDDVATAAFEEADEARVLVAPAVEGSSVNLKDRRDVGVACAGEEELNRHELIFGEVEVVGGRWSCRGRQGRDSTGLAEV
jgi:hypothetical protein